MWQAFGLLNTATEPTIADYEGPMPDEVGPGQWACPLTSLTSRCRSAEAGPCIGCNAVAHC